jgi:hypothetical protein
VASTHDRAFVGMVPVIRPGLDHVPVCGYANDWADAAQTVILSALPPARR